MQNRFFPKETTWSLPAARCRISFTQGEEILSNFISAADLSIYKTAVLFPLGVSTTAISFFVF